MNKNPLVQKNSANRYEQYSLKSYMHIVKTTLYMLNVVTCLDIVFCVFCIFTGNTCFNMVSIFSVAVQVSLYAIQVCSFGKFFITHLWILIYIKNIFLSLVIVTSLMFVNIDKSAIMCTKSVQENVCIYTWDLPLYNRWA